MVIFSYTWKKNEFIWISSKLISTPRGEALQKHCTMGIEGGKLLFFFDFYCIDKLLVLEIQRIVKESGIVGKAKTFW